MKFIKAIDIWAHGEALQNGTLKLQRGQWVKCGSQGPCSRFESVRPSGVIMAFHAPQATAKFLRYISPE